MSREEKTVMFAMPNLLTGHLACVGGTMSGRSWELTAGTFTIGRLDDHDMCLSSEPGVSKTHAKIMGQGDHYIIVDAESRNGTLVNGSPVQKAELFDGDEIRICGCLLRFTQVGGRPRPRVPSAVDHTAAYSQPPIPMAAPPAVPTGPQIMAPTLSSPPMPTPMPQQVPSSSFPTPMAPAAPMAVMLPGPSTGRVLATWYAAGLAASLLLGGAASAALVVSAPEAPAEVPVAVVTPPTVADATPPAPPPPAAVEPTPTPTPTDPAAPADPAAVAPTETPPTPAPVEAVPPPVEAPPPPPPPPEVEPAPVEVAAVEPERRRPSTSSGSSSGPFAAGVEAGGSEVLKSRSGGRVKTALADGAAVSKGTVIVTFETNADAGELATLQDRIASLEGVEGDEAKRDLKAAKQKLAALEGGQNAAPIIASMDGVLQGFSAQPGTIVKAGESLGRVVDTSVTPRVKVTVLRSTRPKNGQKVMMSLKTGGSISGTVVAVSGRTVVIDPGSEPAENIDTVTF